MQKTTINTILFSLILYYLVSSCTEQYALQTNTFEDALVVEATITNELKKQQIKISRSYRFEDSIPTYEADAVVNITDSNGIQYDFKEESGTYVSTREFTAEPEKAYRLNITTKDGRSYTSTNEKLTSINEIQSVIPTVETIAGERGVQININSYSPKADSKYYRYEYEETYKIIAPFWDFERAIITPLKPDTTFYGLNEAIDLIPREGETKTCYSTKYSKDIILTNTNGLLEDRVNFPVRFISNHDYIIANRYSILVRQYVQNLASYTYYKTLKELSGSESILSQNQPGYFYGNLRSLDNPSEKVIGFFEVSSVSEKRIFFDYEDIFPGEPAPPYFTDCDIKYWGVCFVETNPECKVTILFDKIRTNEFMYFDDYYNDDLNYPVYKMVIAPCGDCTTFSSNIKPTFWE